MNLSDQKKLKFDRRLHRRRDWLSPGELEAELEALPDAADKVVTEEEEAAAELEGASSEPARD